MSEYSFDLKAPFQIEAESLWKTAEAIDPAEFEKAVKALGYHVEVPSLLEEYTVFGGSSCSCCVGGLTWQAQIFLHS